MRYERLTRNLLEKGYERVERDDRLLDIFPTDTRAKGVELWVKFCGETVEITRIRLPYKESRVAQYVLPRLKVESALAGYQTMKL